MDTKQESLADTTESIKMLPIKQHLSPKANAFSIASILGQDTKLEKTIPLNQPSPASPVLNIPATPPHADTPPGKYIYI